MATILTKKKDTSGAPSAGDLTNSSGGAELAVNTADKRLYTKDSGGNVVEVGINPTSITTGTLNTSGQVVFNDAGADVDFRVEGDTEANLLFVDASTDRVGIGTSSPDARLRIQNDNSTVPSLIIRDGGTPTADMVQISSNATGTAFLIDSSGNVGIGATSSLEKLTVATSGTNVYSKITDGTVNLYTGVTNSSATAINGTISNHPYAFFTNNAERARITSGGALWVGNTTRQSTDNHTFIASVTTGDWTTNFQNNASSGSPLGVLINYSSIAPNNTGSFFIRTQDSSITRFEVRSNGGVANYSANDVNLSDRREKTNFAPAKNYLETICSIPIQTFNYIDQNLEEDDGLTLGVVAQDVQEVAPELVMESNWGTEENPKMRLSIYQTDLQYALMKCIQELKAELDTVKAELATLKGQ